MRESKCESKSARLAATYTHTCARLYLPAAFILALTHTRARSRRCPCACEHLPCRSFSRLARPRSHPAEASAGVSCSSKPGEPRSPMRMTGAADARRERETEALCCGPVRPSVGLVAREHRQQCGLFARAAVKTAADQPTKPQRSGVHAPGRHSVAYYRAACSSFGRIIGCEGLRDRAANRLNHLHLR